MNNLGVPGKPGGDDLREGGMGRASVDPVRGLGRITLSKSSEQFNMKCDVENRGATQRPLDVELNAKIGVENRGPT